MNTLPPLGRVMNWLDGAGFSVSYTYEDLVFVESNAFLVRFDQQKPETIYVHFNIDCSKSKMVDLERSLKHEARRHQLKAVRDSNFALSQKSDEEIDIRFEG